jgi:hypothetical protein
LFGAGLEDDLLAGEVFELADEVALAASLIDLKTTHTPTTSRSG